MAFSKSSGGTGRETEFAHVRWNIKNPKIPSPNLEFYDAKTKTASFLLEEGETKSVEITGKLINATAFRRTGYNDRQKGNGEQNEWRLMLTLDSGDEKTSSVTFDMISDVNVPNGSTMEVLNSVVKHLEDGGKDTPIQISLYRRKDKNDPDKTYPAHAIRLPSGYTEDGKPLFEDWKNIVRTNALPPRGEPIMQNGKHLEINGMKAYDYENVINWASAQMDKLISFFPKKDAEKQAEADQAEAASNPDVHSEDGVELSEAVDTAVQADRQRMAG